LLPRGVSSWSLPSCRLASLLLINRAVGALGGRPRDKGHNQDGVTGMGAGLGGRPLILGNAGLTESTSSWVSSVESGLVRGELIGTTAQGTPLMTGWPKQAWCTP
jgi:uncharacterized protein YidB (DUF937 family)